MNTDNTKLQPNQTGLTDPVVRSPEQILRDAFDQERVTLVCGKHNYAGGKHQKPRIGCKDCAQVQIMYILAHKKGDKKAALDELEALIHALVELDNEGHFDYQPIRPEITITKDAA